MQVNLWKLLASPNNNTVVIIKNNGKMVGAGYWQRALAEQLKK